MNLFKRGSKPTVFAFSGKLDSMTRAEARRAIERAGLGKTVTNVGQHVTHLVLGKRPGEKLRKARAFRCKIITENQLLKQLNQS